MLIISALFPSHKIVLAQTKEVASTGFGWQDDHFLNGWQIIYNPTGDNGVYYYNITTDGDILTMTLNGSSGAAVGYIRNLSISIDAYPYLVFKVKGTTNAWIAIWLRDSNGTWHTEVSGGVSSNFEENLREVRYYSGMIIDQILLISGTRDGKLASSCWDFIAFVGTRSLKIKVIDAYGLPVSDVSISVTPFWNTITVNPLPATLNVQTDDDGVAFIQKMPDGMYVATVSYLGQTITIIGDAEQISIRIIFSLRVILSILASIAGVYIIYAIFRRRGKGNESFRDNTHTQ